jgi:thioredoxin 2
MADALHIVCSHCDAINRVPRERLREGDKCGSCHRPLFEKHPVALNSAARFGKHAERSDIPLLVDLWASWCGPCRTMAPIFAQAATQLEPDVRLAKVDSDAVPELLQRYSIQSIPTLMLVHHGWEIARQSGVMPLAQLLAWDPRACRRRQSVTGSVNSDRSSRAIWRSSPF